MQATQATRERRRARTLSGKEAAPEDGGAADSAKAVAVSVPGAAFAPAGTSAADEALAKVLAPPPTRAQMQEEARQEAARALAACEAWGAKVGRQVAQHSM